MNKGGRSSSSFLQNIFKLINIERIREMENHHWKNTVKIVVNKIKRWMLKLTGKNWRTGYFSASNYLPRIFISSKGENSSLTMEKHSRHHFNQMTKVKQEI